MKTQHEVFITRTLNIYKSMVKRFAEKRNKNNVVTRYRQQVPFTLEQFRQKVLADLGGETGATKCPYCGSFINADTFVTDHATPVGRGGGLGLDNLVLCCDDCNRIKGKLTLNEYLALRKGLETFAEKARADVYHRLKSGAGFTRMRFIEKPKTAAAAATTAKTRPYATPTTASADEDF